jgi:hypothetical protein
VILSDTNILLRSLDTTAPHYQIVENALAKLTSRQEVLCVAPQNVVEFWSVFNDGHFRRFPGITALNPKLV